MMNLKNVPGRYGVAQLAADAPFPDWANGPGFCSMVRSDDELTVVCQQDRIPEDVPSELGWACFRSIGPVAFDAAGILAELISPISNAGIGVFVLCTFDGEHIMCPAQDYQRVKELLEQEGHVFVAH
ncbi:MAG: ACT domain-containing protein [Litoreibacter sp.]